MPKTEPARPADPALPSNRLIDLVDPRSLISDIAVAGLSEDYAEPRVLDSHAHEDGQLVYAATGVVVVGSEQGYWVVPPTRALWLAPGARHWARTSTRVQIRSVFLSSSEQAHLPLKSCVLTVSPLMREVIKALAERQPGTPMTPYHTALTRVLVLQLREVPILPLHLPALRDHRLMQIERHVLSRPHEHISLEKWAIHLKVDQRTLHRLFVKEAGMPYSKWLQQSQLLLALEWLADGRRIIDISEFLGYNSQSAFTAMFKRNLGMPPAEFFSNTVEQ